MNSELYSDTFATFARVKSVANLTCSTMGSVRTARHFPPAFIALAVKMGFSRQQACRLVKLSLEAGSQKGRPAREGGPTRASQYVTAQQSGGLCQGRNKNVTIPDKAPRLSKGIAAVSLRTLYPGHPTRIAELPEDYLRLIRSLSNCGVQRKCKCV
jgi:hypothetical protein